MKNLYRNLVFVFLPVTLLASACDLPQAASLDPLNQETIAVIAAQTISANQTQEAREATLTSTFIPPTETQLPPTATIAPSRTPLPTSTPITPLPSQTPVPSPTPTPSPTPSATLAPGAVATSTPGSVATPGSGQGGNPTAVVCNWAQFVKDVTIPDGTILHPGAFFTKVWRVKNIGNCPWTSQYRLVFDSGELMGDKKEPLPKNVKPGETVDIAVNLVAPKDPGKYEASWMLRSASNRFGVGSGANGALTVEIEVKDTGKNIIYDFVTNYCAAEWENSEGDLPCPGNEGNSSGFVIRLDTPVLEEHMHENEPALWTNPEMVNDGMIAGTYPAFEVKAGDRFLSDIGCLEDNKGCNVVFQLRYRIDDGPVQKLDGWQEIYDGEITRIDFDLSALSGEWVQFILFVKTNGNYKDDAAFWLVPQIRR